MAETLREAVTFIEQGHVRVGPDTGNQAPFGSLQTLDQCLQAMWYIIWFLIGESIWYMHWSAVTDPAFLITRNMEDFVTWVDTSKIKRKVLKYNDKLDDYDLLNV